MALFSASSMSSYSAVGSTTNVQFINYDLEAITPTTWQKVELKYSDVFNGKRYPAEIKLLRPVKWLKDNDMDKVGNKVNLSIPEFGVRSVHATVTAIKATTLNTSKIDWFRMNSRPVIGRFVRYAPIVKTYTFKNVNTGRITTINATPNHPFYVENKYKFVPIEDVTSNDRLVNSAGQVIKLICNNGQNKHCGKLYNTNGKPIPVYNVEVYQKHVYFIGDDRVLVHNVCGKLEQKSSLEDRGKDTEFKNLQKQVLPYKNEPEGKQAYFDDISGADKCFINEQGERLSGKFNFITTNSEESLKNPFLNTVTSHSGNQIDLYIDPILHHDNIASGKPVTYAGTVDFSNGMVINWDNKSGHYQPFAIYSDQSPFDLKKFHPWEIN